MLLAKHVFSSNGSTEPRPAASGEFNSTQSRYGAKAQPRYHPAFIASLVFAPLQLCAFAFNQLLPTNVTDPRAADPRPLVLANPVRGTYTDKSCLLTDRKVDWRRRRTSCGATVRHEPIVFQRVTRLTETNVVTAETTCGQKKRVSVELPRLAEGVGTCRASP